MTSFEFHLHPVGPVVTAGAILFQGEAAGELLRFYREWVEEIPGELTTVVSLGTASPVAFLPEDVHGKRVVVVSGCYVGRRMTAPRPFDRSRSSARRDAPAHA